MMSLQGATWCLLYLQWNIIKYKFLVFPHQPLVVDALDQ
jgi:hypothetical protein